MTTQMQSSPDAHLQGRWLTVARVAWYVCAVLAAIVLLGALPAYYTHYAQAVRSDPYGLGLFNLSFQVLVRLSDLASGFISFALAILLFWRKPNDRMALFASFFFLIAAVVWSYALDYFLTAYFGAPSTYGLWSNLLTPLGILLFCIFPDGRFVPRWARWVFLVSILASLRIFAGAEVRAIASYVTYPLFFLVLYAQVYRYRRVSSYAERKQTRWVVFGFVVSVGLSLIASIIYKKPSPPLLNIFPLALTIAILRSHLWDIDIIIRRALLYSVLTGLLAIIYFGGIVLLQTGFQTLLGAGDSPLVTVLSTLAVAALTFPLRARVQDFIDRRFFRRKYDAQKVLAEFAATARDETDLDKLTARLAEVVQKTMQPDKISLWLKESNTQAQRHEDGK